MRSSIMISILIAAVIIVSGCANISREVTQMGDLGLSSPAFSDNGRIPGKHTCRGEDVSPELVIADVPDDAKSLVIIMDDPDAPMGTWVHWVVFNIPLVPGISEDSVPAGAVQGKNGWSRNDYGGPCPPSGTHRYVFKLYALDTMLDLEAGSAKEQVEQAMEGHILAQTKLTGLFGS